MLPLREIWAREVRVSKHALLSVSAARPPSSRVQESQSSLQNLHEMWQQELRSLGQLDVRHKRMLVRLPQEGLGACDVPRLREERAPVLQDRGGELRAGNAAATKEEAERRGKNLHHVRNLRRGLAPPLQLPVQVREREKEPAQDAFVLWGRLPGQAPNK